jgi:hypothetical protein
LAKRGKAVADRSRAEIGSARKNQPGRFTASVRIDYLNAHEGIAS